MGEMHGLTILFDPWDGGLLNAEVTSLANNTSVWYTPNPVLRINNYNNHRTGMSNFPGISAMLEYVIL